MVELILLTPLMGSYTMIRAVRKDMKVPVVEFAPQHLQAPEQIDKGHAHPADHLHKGMGERAGNGYQVISDIKELLDLVGRNAGPRKSSMQNAFDNAYPGDGFVE